jgi:branched-subunit amino acid transport protein AzlD
MTAKFLFRIFPFFIYNSEYKGTYILVQRYGTIMPTVLYTHEVLASHLRKAYGAYVFEK